MNKLNQDQNPPLRELIALSLVPRLGAQRIRRLLQTVDHAQDIFRMSRKELMRADGIGPAVAGAVTSFNDWKQVDRIISKTRREGSRLLSFWDPEYPGLLREIYDPPVLLWIMGAVQVLDTPGIAVVGTRRAGKYGKQMAEYFTEQLVEQGLTIVSGLALGIDGVAHKTTLKANGHTVAVLGSGIDNIYPRKHTHLAHEIVEMGGAVISEFPLGTAPDACNFPVRNRIVSGLTLGTLVVESGIEGGSMITARSALDQNREVFLVPHNLDSRNGMGCNALIKRGMGKLVQEVDDILNEIPISKERQTAEMPVGQARWKDMELDCMSVSICEALEESPLHIDDLGAKLERPAHVLLPKLLELEMMDCLRQTAGKIFELK